MTLSSQTKTTQINSIFSLSFPPMPKPNKAKSNAQTQCPNPIPKPNAQTQSTQTESSQVQCPNPMPKPNQPKPNQSKSSSTSAELDNQHSGVSPLISLFSFFLVAMGSCLKDPCCSIASYWLWPRKWK